MGSVDPAYAAADTAGFAMNWSTFLTIIHSMVTVGEAQSAAYLLQKDASGHYLLFGKPVYISPSLSNIGAGSKPVLFGDWSRFIIRHVPTDAIVRRYDELYMQNFQKGYEMLFRADASIMHAGGAGDDPIKALDCAVGS